VVETQGYPIRTSELLATLDGAGYVVRRSVTRSKEHRMAKKAIRLAFETQVRGAWLLRWSSCFPPARPTVNLTPVESL